MKLVIKDANLLAAFRKVEGKESVAQAVVLAGATDKAVYLVALGDASIKLGVEGLTEGHYLTAGQTVQFTADGTFAVEPSITAPATEKVEEAAPGRVHTGGSSPLAAPEKPHRFA